MSSAEGFCGPVHTPTVTLLLPGRRAGRKRLPGAVRAGWFSLNVPHFPGRTKHFAEQNEAWVSPQQRGMTIVGRVGKQELGRRQIKQQHRPLARPGCKLNHFSLPSFMRKWWRLISAQGPHALTHSCVQKPEEVQASPCMVPSWPDVTPVLSRTAVNITKI